MANRVASAAKGKDLPMMEQLAEELKLEIFDYKNKYDSAGLMLQSSEEGWQELINTSQKIKIPDLLLKNLRKKLKGVNPLVAAKMENALLELLVGEVYIEEGRRDFTMTHEGIAFLEHKEFDSSMIDYDNSDLNLSSADQKKFKRYLKAGLPAVSRAINRAIGKETLTSIKIKLKIASDKGNKAYKIQKGLNAALPSIYDKVSSLRLMNFYSRMMENQGSNPCSDFTI